VINNKCKISDAWYKDHFEEVFSQATDKPEGSEKANRAIMTTDLVPKTFAVEIDSLGPLLGDGLLAGASTQRGQQMGVKKKRGEQN
jgi:N-acetylglutamate synthase/N-acetylornithine aminotransferase